MSDGCPYQKSWDGKYIDVFCSKCYRHERFFSGGGSWSPDLCACGWEGTTVWYKMGPMERSRAKKKYKVDLEIWRRKNQ